MYLTKQTEDPIIPNNRQFGVTYSREVSFLGVEIEERVLTGAKQMGIT